MRRLLPQSLGGQMALLVAVALYIAQTINFALLFSERHATRFSTIILPAVTRLNDASERLTNQGKLPDQSFRPGQRGTFPDRRPRVQVFADNPIDPHEKRRTDIEGAFREGMQGTVLTPKQIIAVVRPIDENSLILRRMDRSQADRARRQYAELQIAIQRPDGRWLMLTTGWGANDDLDLVWSLLAQLLILYIVVLIPVLWAGRRIARPLRTLAQAAQRFTPGEETRPLEELGPKDVRSVIAAYNHLSLRVNAMLDEKNRMLGAIGHDLRTPLAALRVRIESVEDDEDRARMADTIDEMNRTLDDILSLARLGRPSEPVTEVDLAALIDAVVEDFRDLDEPVTFEETPRVAMRLRPSLVRRALRNLIENAIKYAGSAEVRLIAHDKSVAIEVADRGPGIPSDKFESVFDAFTRLENSRNRDTGGIGLGLALARAIVREAGGDIHLAARDGGGLRATISLPRYSTARLRQEEHA